MPQAKQKKQKRKFARGDRVRVRKGTLDPDFPDIPIGGWAGTVKEIYRATPPNYLIQLSRETLDNLHPIYKKRCERDGLDYEKIGLSENDLEPDTGGPLEIEHPKQIQARPLDPSDEDDRIRMALGLTGDDPLPDVHSDTLRSYRDYLARNLSFPFEAIWEWESGALSMSRQKVKVVGVGDPEDEFRLDDHYGLICEVRVEGRSGDAPLAELEVKKKGQNRQLIKDYNFWFWNCR